MLQQNNFYMIKSFSTTEKKNIHAEIELNASHNIFKGHFPGSPVLPGVCLIQISKEILENALGVKTALVQSSQSKFLAVVNPTVDIVLKIALETKEQDGLISLNSTISGGEKIFFKFKGGFKRYNV